MSSSSPRSLLRVLLDSVFVAWSVALALSFVAAIVSGGSALWARVGLLVVPLGGVALLVAAPLPFFFLANKKAPLLLSIERDAREHWLLGPVVVLAWWALGWGSLQVLSAFSERPAWGGVLLGALAAATVTAANGLIRAGARAWTAPPPAPRWAWGASAVVVLLGLGVSVLVGTTSGTGAPWALFGVFKRPELDLSAAGWAVGVALATVAGASLVATRGAGRAALWLGIAALALSSSAFYQATQLDFKQAVEVERRGGLGASSLRALQAWSDRDHDGSAAWFGGGDCDDGNRAVHPLAVEDFDNDRDDNCDGIQTRPAATEAPDQADAAEPPPNQHVSAPLPPQLNVLLLTVDTMRAELGYAGLPGTRPNISPHLDELASRSTVFERAYALASYTSKSLGPMLIGTYPSETPRSFEHFDRFPSQATFVQERIQKAGIQTLSIQGYWYFYFKGYGFERGWDTLEHGAAPRVIAIEGDRTKNGDKVADDTIMYLKQLADRPARFFMWTHWVDPHAEYVAHEAHDYGKQERDRYDGEISFVDAQIGRVLAALSEAKLAEKTMIIVTSDHGEAFGEHGMIRHGFEVWEELVHVPLLVHVPGAAPRRITQRRSLIDVAPTILEALELPIAPQDFSGQSLLGDVLGPAGAPASARPVLVDMPEGPHNKERRAFYTGDHKLIVSAGRALGLYDLRADPGEKRDLSEDAALLAKVRAEYDAFLAGLDVVAAKK